ncbi:MAG: hypothetical protein AAF517_27650 [Planctomycetota bacterium]
MRRALWVASALLALGVPTVLQASSVGDSAPELEPREWLNTKGKTTWAKLKGRAIVIEKWATW